MRHLAGPSARFAMYCCALCVSVLHPCNAAAPRAPLTVPYAAWQSLNQAQRDLLTAKFVVEVAEKDRFARIVYVQGVNESTPATSTGAQLGSLYGQAQYIDKSNWRNYSAKGQLGAAILGGLIGSTLDSPARASFRQVYTLKASDGSITTMERISTSPIYVAPGLCVDTTSFTPVRDELCDGGLTEETRGAIATATSGPPDSATSKSEDGRADPIAAQHAATATGETYVMCRMGATANIQTTAQRCIAAGGSIQP
jgi:hypothetical protein